VKKLAKGANAMKLTKHAKIRSQQRGFSKEDISWLMLLGEPKAKPGNVMEYTVKGRDKDIIISKLKKIIQLIEKIGKKAILIDGEDIITVYNLR
jgi:hypothetical protein